MMSIDSLSFRWPGDRRSQADAALDIKRGTSTKPSDVDGAPPRPRRVAQ